VTYAELSITRTTEPEDGQDLFFDYYFKGFDCKGDGKIDKRQRSAHAISFINQVAQGEFLCELASKTNNPDIQREASQYLDRAIIRRREQLQEILGDELSKATS
jgi:hypothetical protein